MTRGILIWFFAFAAFILTVSTFLLAGCSATAPAAIEQPKASHDPTLSGFVHDPLLSPKNSSAAPVQSQAIPSKQGPDQIKPQNPVSRTSPADKGQFSPKSYPTYFGTNQRLLEGYYSSAVDERDVDAVFWVVFSQLPDEVTVFPSENYYYFILGLNGRQLWGNIRLAAGHRELGQLSFAYFEFDEFAYASGRQFFRAKVFTVSDGLVIKEIDSFTYAVAYKNKSVTFNMLRLPQKPPRLFRLGSNEVFVMRTFDESGYQFFLLFNEAKKYFFWVLNEEDGVPDALDPMGNTGDVFRGRRSGFVFWEDTRNDGRKILVSVRQQSVERNDYFDGPFDQLADNYVDETKVSEYIVKASPSLEGKIDKYGYYTVNEPGMAGMRVALSMYYSHYYDAQVLEFINNMRNQEDPYWYIARRGLPPYTPPVSAPAPATAPQPSSPAP